MAEPLVQTKVHIPPVRPELVSRSRLLDRLDAGLDLGHRLTLISAPAGFGKTTLLSEWAARIRAAWLSVDEGDNDPARFLAYLVAAFRAAGEDVSDALPDVGRTSQATSPEGVLAELINRVGAAPASFVLILDDYHLITAQPIHDAIAFLLDHLPGNMHLAIATRADPPLPVARLRGRGQLTELRLPDLRFTPEEAAEFLNHVMGLGLTADDVAALESRTEGWIAGLQMAAVALRPALSTDGDAASFVRDFTGSNRFILDYLIEEVLQHQPEHVQTFLLQTSILDRLCGPLCDAVAGERGQALLEYLDSSNLFIVPLDNERRWYRYHRLFADLLRGRLQHTDPELVPVLHRRASRWHEERGLTTEAIDHALAAGNVERAADLVEQNAEATLMRGEATTFLHWVDALPDEEIRARPTLCVFHAWMLLMYGRPLAVVESRLQDAERGGALVAGRVAALRGLMAAFRGHTSRAAELSRRALEQLPAEEQFVRAFATWILRTAQFASGEDGVDGQTLDDALRMSQRAGNVMVAVMGTSNQAELHMRQGKLHQAAAGFRKALDLATDAQGRRLPIAGQALIGLGELSREWGDLDAAARDLEEGIHLTEQWTEVGPFDAYIALARVRRAQGDVAGAWEAIRKAKDLAVAFDVTELDDLSVALFEAWMQVAEGDLEAARRWAEERDLYTYIDAPLQEEAGDSYHHRIRKYELVVLARLLLASKRPGKALRLLETLVPAAEWRGRPTMLIEIHVLQALAHRAQGATDRAMQAFERALSLAEPEGYVQIFADEGEPVVALLQEAAKRGVAMAYVDTLLGKMGIQGSKFQSFRFQVTGKRSDLRPETLKAETLIEPLTEREMDVLRLLNTHLSSTEMAEQLYISVNTVRYHIKNIYGKLHVHRRSDAVQRAEELGLL